ncbi:MAG: amidohydrolase family protein [Phycisphaeraceae bacterium]
MPKRIFDSHHHLWDYDAEQYPWIPVGSPLEQSYGLADLAAHAEGCNLEASVVVQARQTLEETDWLLSLSKQNPLCKAVVGWVPLQDENVAELLARYADEPLLKGVRHVIQDEQDPEFMIRPEFLRGLEALSETRLRYDILIFGHQLPNTIKMVDALPGDMPLVLDHIGKPVINADSGEMDRQWEGDFAALAQRPNVMCKLSGMATEVRGRAWDAQTLKPYVNHALACFGVERLMFGSDWPVCLLRTEYARWVDTLGELLGGLSEDERDRVFYRNAQAFYGVVND